MVTRPSKKKKRERVNATEQVTACVLKDKRSPVRVRIARPEHPRSKRIDNGNVYPTPKHVVGQVDLQARGRE
jgi:hypothetical protein